MPMWGLMVGTSLHVLEVMVVTLGSEDDCNIHFLCNVDCLNAGLVSHEGQ
jgi:hypothetical protein